MCKKEKVKMLKPSVDCNSLRVSDIGKNVILAGWVSSWRDHGGVIFIDIRDINGVTQIVFGRGGKDSEEGLIKDARKLRNEYVIAVEGEVVPRPEGTLNKNIDTGVIEVVVRRLEILNTSKELPFDLKNPQIVSEEIRLKYRYLEMRAGRLKDNLIFKHRLFQETRNYFSSQGFYEIETPFLARSTPEGARDFLVPSRLNQGKFYALPQSPQLFKQILMVGGFMKYFQIVRCFRDEDLRQDRQPEFTQLDIEMSFIDEEDIKCVLEGYIVRLFDRLLGVKLNTPFKSISFADAMKKYGSDKPDMRNPIEIKDISDIAGVCGFRVFNSAVKEGGAVRGIKVSADDISLSAIDKLTEEIKPFGAKGLAWMRHKDGVLQSQITKFFNEDELCKISKKFDTAEGDILFFIADVEDVVSKCLGWMRDKFHTPDDKDFVPVWIEDYPLFEKGEGGWSPVHHPFTAPHPDDIRYLSSDPLRVRSRAYDLVLNGAEIGGGSIRIHSMELQKKVFNILGISPEESKKRFGFLLRALQYGAPPHGGFAFGLDRLTAKLLNISSIRDVIPFPKTQKAYSPLTDAPSIVDEEQLKELALRLDIVLDKK